MPSPAGPFASLPDILHWSSFASDVLPLLVDALTTNVPGKLVACIDRYLAELTDPYEGDSLPADWQDALQNRDVHEYGDYALTRFYDPADCWGIGYEWTLLDDELPPPASNAVLGSVVGPAENRFDPGRYGSFFWTSDQVGWSLAVLQSLDRPELVRFLALLERCVAEERGLYVTFRRKSLTSRR
jgi:hypothetical protein